MKKLLLRWVLLAISVFGASLVTEALKLGFRVDIVDFRSVVELFVGVAVLSLLNATLGKLIKLMTLPLSCITLGLFSLVINALVLWLAASLKLGFAITGSGPGAFIAAFVASILISIINGVLGIFLPDDDKDD
ncbi:MAG: phage holin family protein [Fimbriimonas sp.]